MAVTLLPNGLWQAKKQIDSRTFQSTHTSEEAALNRQSLYESMYVPTFRPNGSMIGVTLQTVKTKHKSYVYLIYKDNRFKTSDGFERAWQDLLTVWKNAREYSARDMVSYRDEIREAKQFYIRKFGQLEAG